MRGLYSFSSKNKKGAIEYHDLSFKSPCSILYIMVHSRIPNLQQKNSQKRVRERKLQEFFYQAEVSVYQMK